MADKPKKPKQRNSSLEEAQARIPATPSLSDLPAEYANLLAELKQRIREERLRVVITANAAMVLLYWDIALLDKLDDPEARLWYARRARDVHKPIGVAEWETRLVETLPEELRGSLPTVKELEAELQQVEEMKKEHGHGG